MAGKNDMKIAVLGAGNIGGTLSKKWAKAGHEVVFGVRDVSSPKVQALLETIEGEASADTIANAIAFGEVVVLAIPGKEVEAVVQTYADILHGKIIIDATNKFGSPEMSGMAVLAAKVPGAKPFRAFNSLGWENFAEPQFGQIQADLLYCGADNEARPIVEELIAEVGLRPVRVGDLDQIQLVDSLGALWAALVFGQGMGRHLAFKVLTA